MKFKNPCRQELEELRNQHFQHSRMISIVETQNSTFPEIKQPSIVEFYKIRFLKDKKNKNHEINIPL